MPENLSNQAMVTLIWNYKEGPIYYQGGMDPEAVNDFSWNEVTCTLERDKSGNIKSYKLLGESETHLSPISIHSSTPRLAEAIDDVITHHPKYAFSKATQMGSIVRFYGEAIPFNN